MEKPYVIATLKTALNPIKPNGKCLTKIQLMFIIFILSSNGRKTPTASTDLEENTEDELATDISNWSDKDCKKLQHMTEFHEEYQRVFGDRVSLHTIIRKRIS